MKRFLLSFQAVEFMRQGKSPTEAAILALQKIAKYYPHYKGGLVAVNKDGKYGMLSGFHYTPAFKVRGFTLKS